MVRFLAAAVCALLIASPLEGSAHIPPTINLHNGFIRVFNHIHYLGARRGLVVRIKYERHDETTPDIYFNNCCYAAGSTYELFVEPKARSGTTDDSVWDSRTIFVKPRLCNIDGIPFGYAEVEVTGQMVPGTDTHPEVIENFHVQETTTVCPTK